MSKNNTPNQPKPKDPKPIQEGREPHEQRGGVGPKRP